MIADDKMPGTDRRSSTSSEEASVPPVRQILQDGTELIPTRTAKTGAPKPAANPLQFIKVGPCDLYKAAQEQLKKVEEIKKVEKTVKEDSEDWQSNLDNWKCSRRKRQEHIIDRVVEVKKLELEEHERNRRRGKTLSEMMEERTQKGVGPRKMSLLVYPDDDAADLTDLGITVSEKTNENGEEQKEEAQSSGNETNGKKNGANGHEVSPEPEEYTYERAIQGYKSFAEKTTKAASRPRVSPPKPGGRIGEKLNELEQVRLRSNSVSDVQLPKVDIHKRRSLFEVVESAETQSPSAERVAKDLGGAQIVKARLSSLERKPEIPAKPAPKVAEEVSVSIKDRLSSLEKQKEESARRAVNEEVVKERLTCLDKGLKESINSNSSDEEIGGGQKELLSPAVSDREVSSPLVSSLDGEKVKEEGINSEDKGSNMVMVNSKDSISGCQKSLEGNVEEKADDRCVVEDVKKAKEDANYLTAKNQIACEPKTIEQSDGINVEASVNEKGDVAPAVKDAEKISESTDFEKIADDSEAKNKTEVVPVEKEVVPKYDCQENNCKPPDEQKDNLNLNNEDSTHESVNCVVPNTPESQVKLEDKKGNTEETKYEETETNVAAEVITKEQEAVMDADNKVLSDTSTKIPSPLKAAAPRRKIISKPVVRRRKLTPILTAPITVLSPVKAPGDLQMIREDAQIVDNDKHLQGLLEDEEEEEDDGAVKNEEQPVPAKRQTAKGAETSESGIDMEESSLYTDENIDEVLGVDDVEEDDYLQNNNDDHSSDYHQGGDDHVPDSARDLELSRRQMEAIRGGNDSGFSEFDKNLERMEESYPRYEEDLNEKVDEIDLEEMERRQQEAVTRFDELIGISKEELSPVKKLEKEVEIIRDMPVEKKEEPMVEAPLVDLAPMEAPKQIQPPASYENVFITNQLVDLTIPGEVIGFPLSPLSSVEPPKEKPPPPPVEVSDEETPAPELPPKQTSLRRLDSTKRIKKEIRKKRSDFLGIDGPNDDAYLEPEVNVEPPPDMLTLLQEERRLDQQLYRQSLSSEADSADISSPRPNAVDRLDQALYRQSICSETDSNHETAESRDSGVELDRGHVDDLCWNKENSETHSRQNSEPFGNPSVTSEEDEISKKEREIIEVLEKEEEWRYGKALSAPEDSAIGETLAVKLRQIEQEKLQLEWERAEEEGRRMADEERLLAKETLLRQQEENLRAERERLEKEQIELARVRQKLLAAKRASEPPRQGPMTSNLRYSMPDLQDSRPPPPHARVPSAWTRVTSAENLLSSQPTTRASAENLAPQQMSRTTRQALSAAPRSRIVNGEAWMQPKRKADAPKSSYNYQHWLIQEAEHRRITEQQQRATQSRRSLPNTPRVFSPTRQAAQQPQPRPHSGHFPPSQSPNGPQYVIQPNPSHTHSHSQPQNAVQYPGQSAPNHAHSHSQPQNGVQYANQLAPNHAHSHNQSQNGIQYASQAVPNHGHSHSQPQNGIQYASHASPSHAHSHTTSPPSHHTVGLPPTPHNHHNKPLPEAVIQTLTQRVQNKVSPRRRLEERLPPSSAPAPDAPISPHTPHINGDQERMLSVSGKKKCSHCGEELGRGAAMVIESLRLFYHIDCFKCCVCHTQLGDGLMGTDVRVRNNKLHCHNCYSSDDGVKFSCV